MTSALIVLKEENNNNNNEGCGRGRRCFEFDKVEIVCKL